MLYLIVPIFLEKHIHCLDSDSDFDLDIFCVKKDNILQTYRNILNLNISQRNIN